MFVVFASLVREFPLPSLRPTEGGEREDTMIRDFDTTLDARPVDFAAGMWTPALLTLILKRPSASMKPWPSVMVCAARFENVRRERLEK